MIQYEKKVYLNATLNVIIAMTMEKLKDITNNSSFEQAG